MKLEGGRMKLEEDLNELCQEVKTFFGIKERIIIEYHTDFSFAYMVMNPPRIFVGMYFFRLNDEEQKAVTAHELGHYICDKNNHPNKTKRQEQWVREYKFPPILNSLSKKGRHRKKKIQKWYILSECYADNQVVEVGYGYSLLTILKFLKKNSNIPFIPFFNLRDKKEIKARIKNLEQKLKEMEG